MLSNLDQLDRQVIAALQSDGRRSFVAMAESFGVAESVIRYRVQRLEKAGVLQVVGIADPMKIGFDLMSLVGIRVRPGTTDDVCRALQEFPETSYVVAVAGQYDVFVEVVCRDTAHFQELLNTKMHRIDGIQSTEAFLILEIHKMAYGWGVGDAGVPLASDESLTVPEPPSRAVSATKSRRAKPKASSSKQKAKRETSS